MSKVDFVSGPLAGRSFTKSDFIRSMSAIGVISVVIESDDFDDLMNELEAEGSMRFSTIYGFRRRRRLKWNGCWIYSSDYHWWKGLL